MSTHRTSLAANTARIVWGGLALVLTIGLLATVFLSRGSVDDAEAEAERRAADWANTVLFEALTPEQVQGSILGPDYRELLIVVQAGIRSDDRTARVRIWNAEGALVFSDDQRDKIGEFVATDNPQIETALSGETVSVPTQATVAPRSGLAGSDEKLFQTFVPLRLENQLGISGVVQIDQRYAAIEAEGSDIWQTIRLVLVLALTVVVGLFLFSLRARPVSVGAEETAEGAPPSRQDRRALERAKEAEAQLRIVTARAETAEATVAEAEGTVSEAVVRLRELEQRAARAEERATNAEAALQEAAQRMTGGEAPRRGVPGVGAVAVTAAAGDLEAKLDVAEAEREQLKGELGRVRSALTEREAELEQRAAEATREAAEAGTRITELEGQLRTAEDAVAATAATTAKKRKGEKEAADELRAARLEVNDLQMRLAEAQTALEQAQSKLLESEARAAEPDTKTAELEKAHARTTKELEAARAELAKADAELVAARQTLTDKEQGSVAGKQAEDRAAVVEAALAEMETRVREVEARATKAETRATKTEGSLAEAVGKLAEADAKLADADAKLADAEAARGDLVAELERTRAEAAKAAIPVVEAEREDVETLRQRVAELEDARRNDVTELQRAQEALANTQFENAQARRRVKELEERLEELQAAPAATADQMPAPVVEEPMSFAARLSHLVREHEAPVEPEPVESAEVDESTLSLRERLARAAAARHRAPGAPGPDR